jgi:hypothetical protein
VQTL